MASRPAHLALVIGLRSRCHAAQHREQAEHVGAQQQTREHPAGTGKQPAVIFIWRLSAGMCLLKRRLPMSLWYSSRKLSRACRQHIAPTQACKWQVPLHSPAAGASAWCSARQQAVPLPVRAGVQAKSGRQIASPPCTALQHALWSFVGHCALSAHLGLASLRLCSSQAVSQAAAALLTVEGCYLRAVQRAAP